MKTKAKLFLFLGLFLVMGMLLAACQDGEKSTGDGEGGTEESGDDGNKLADKQVLHMSKGSEPASLDIHHATDAISFGIDYQIRSGLMTLNDKGEIVPDMAAEMPKVSEDKTVYTFTIRDDAVWSDGSPVTAQNFVYAWQRDVNPEEAGDYAYIFSNAGIKNAEKIMKKGSDIYGQVEKLGIKALGEKKLQITLEKPTPFFLSLMTFPPFYPLKEEVVTKYGDDYATDVDKMVYNGAYVLSEWNHGQGWTFTKNPDYWNADQVKLEKVKTKVVKEAATGINLYETGKLDFVSLTSQFITKYQGKKGFHKGSMTPVMYFLRLNQSEGPLANEHIRDAIYNAIDRENLVKNLLKDGSNPAHYLVPKNFAEGPNGNDFRKAMPSINKTSVEEAKKSWEKGLKAIGKDKVTLKLLTTDGSKASDVGIYIKAQLEENLPGLTVKINKQPSGNFYTLRSSLKYDMALSNWVPDYQDPMTYLSMWVTDGPSNESAFSNKKYDKLIKQIRNAGADLEKRWELMHNAEKVLLENSGMIPLYQDADAYILKPYVKHFLVRTYGPETDWTYTKVMEH